MSKRCLHLIGGILVIFMLGVPSLGNETDPKDPNEYLNKNFRKCVEIHEIIAQPKLDVDESKVYICDILRSKIYIFKKNTGEKINTFGSQGEGPQEFIYISGTSLTKDTLYVTSPLKLSIFSKDGKFQKEMRAVINCDNYIPLNQNFLAKRYDYDSKGNVFLIYSLFDNQLEKIKDVSKFPYKKLTPKDKNKYGWILFRECQKAEIYKDRIYIGISDLGFFFAVFDNSGNKLNDIKIDYDKIPISNSFKEKILNNIKVMQGDNYDRFKQKTEVLFPEYFPAFVNFFIYNDRIYVFKYPVNGTKGKTGVVVLDLDGKVLKSLMLDLQDISMGLQTPGSVSFFDGKIYFFTEIESEEKIIIKELDIRNM